jgi:hypothetical protein
MYPNWLPSPSTWDGNLSSPQAWDLEVYEGRFNPNHSKEDGKFASGSGGSANSGFTKHEESVEWGGSYVQGRIWNIAGGGTIQCIDSKFSDELVEKRIIPHLNKLAADNPLANARHYSVSIEPSVYLGGHEAYAITQTGTQFMRLHGGLLRDGAQATIDNDVHLGHLAPAAKGKGIEAILTHEWGHAITPQKGLDPRVSTFFTYSGDQRISKYAGVSDQESFAENFLEFYESGGKTNSESALAYAEEFKWNS